MPEFNDFSIVSVLTAAKCCMSGSVKCQQCPFNVWGDNCYDVLIARLDRLIEQNKKKCGDVTQ